MLAMWPHVLSVTVIRPTGTCFDDALDTIESLCRSGITPAELDEFRVVHGIVTATPVHGSVDPFAHGWLEYLPARVVVQSGIIDGQKRTFSMRLEEFVDAFRPVATTRYTMAEVVAENERCGTTGPWRPEYIALCKRQGE